VSGKSRSKGLSADFSSVGLAVGHATDTRGATGLTVLRAVDGYWRGGACVFGRATGTREVEALSTTHSTGRVDAVMLTGGSAYGLDAAAGVMDWMEDNGRGFPVGPGVVPIVPAAVVFDLTPLGRFDARPTRAMAFNACEHASPFVTEGSIGVGAGVTVGKVLGPSQSRRSGFGCSTITSHDDEVHIAAMAVVNAFGDVVGADGEVLAGPRTDGGELARTAEILSAMEAPPEWAALSERNTTLVCVMTDAALDKAACARVARMASGGVARAVDPVHSDVDGDVAFCLSSGSGATDRFASIAIGTIAATVTAAAIRDSVPRPV